MSDLDRLRHEYADRERRLVDDDRYSTSNPAYRFMKAQLHGNIHSLLGKHGRRVGTFDRILEIGCGNGNVLDDFRMFGKSDQSMFGIDLLTARIEQARSFHPRFSLACSDGQRLPFPARSFDLVIQFTAFSSILDEQIRKNMSVEMRRVVRSTGLILWYDFWLNPTNPQTRGIRPAEIKQLFPGCRYEFHRITLAPPITRRLATASWGLCLFLESLKIFNTHYLVAIQPD